MTYTGRTLWDEVQRWLAYDYTRDELIRFLSNEWTPDFARLVRLVEIFEGDTHGSGWANDLLYATPAAVADAIARLNRACPDCGEPLRGTSLTPNTNALVCSVSCGYERPAVEGQSPDDDLMQDASEKYWLNRQNF